MKMFSGLSLVMTALVSLMGVAAFALPAKVVSNSYSFTLNSNWDFGGKVYYSCDSVEGTATDMLKKMGARNVSVDCSGGMDATNPGWPPMDAYLSVKYDSVKAASGNDGQTVQADYASVVLRDYQNCFMANQLFKKFSPTFDIKDLTGLRSCMEPESNYKYSFDVLK
jgi:hypothetical protein